MISNSPVSNDSKPAVQMIESVPKVSMREVRKHLSPMKHRTKSCGDWSYEQNQLMLDLVDGRKSLRDVQLQSEFLDWIETPDYNKFRNLETNEIVYAQVAKRGNVAYAARKAKNRDSMKDALDGKVFDEPLKGSHDLRRTRLLLITTTFDNSLFSMEEAWAALRSKPIEGSETVYNVLNKLNANISKIFGKHGTLISKEAQSNGYPAPHIIVLLDKPVIVKRHVGKNGHISYRLFDPHILNRVGKGDLMRKLCKKDHRVAIEQNPIWPYGFIDIEGIVSENGSRSCKNAILYPFKYMTKCLTEDGSNSIKDVPDISSVEDKGLRTMLYTHFGNKCFRTRDVSFGKAFKDRIGMLPSTKESSDHIWKRVRTVNQLEYEWIKAYDQAVSEAAKVVSLSKEAIT